MSKYTNARLFLLLLVGAGPFPALADELLFAPVPLDLATAPAERALPMPLQASPVPAVAPPDRDALLLLEQDAGAYAPELAALYLQQARAWQASGRHEAALEAVSKAIHSERVHEGLFTPTQYEAVTLQVQSLLAQGDWQGAIERQEHLLFLQRRHLGEDSLETISSQEVLGDLYFEAFRQVLLDPGAAVTLRLPYGEKTLFRRPEEFTRTQMAYLWLNLARDEYHTAIAKLVQAGRLMHPRLATLERQLIQILLLQAFERHVSMEPENFLHARDPFLRGNLRMDELARRQPYYRAGIEAHERLVAYQTARPDVDHLATAEAMLSLGDWHLLFGRAQAAREQYARTHAWLEASGVPQASAAALLQPQVPHQVPAFAGITGTHTAVEFLGYVDVAFSIGKSGRVEDFEVLAATDNADMQVQRQLQDELRRAPFRPAIDDSGHALKEHRVSLRYHFARI